jgi:hypothetical protein
MWRYRTRQRDYGGTRHYGGAYYDRGTRHHGGAYYDRGTRHHGGSNHYGGTRHYGGAYYDRGTRHHGGSNHHGCTHHHGVRIRRRTECSKVSRELPGVLGVFS